MTSPANARRAPGEAGSVTRRTGGPDRGARFAIRAGRSSIASLSTESHMQLFVRRMTIGAALVLVAPLAAHAQTESRPIELGIDAGIDFALGDNSVTTVSIPAQRFRAGFFLSNAVSLEPAASLVYAHSGGGSSSIFGGELGVLFHTTAATENDNRYYLRPFLGVQHIHFSSGDNSDGATQTHVGAGAGVKMPLVDRLAFRFEVNFAHAFEASGANGTGHNGIGVLGGFSFFTK